MSLKKVQNKINEGIVDLRAPLATQSSKHFHRKSIFAAVCLLSIVVLLGIIVGFGSSKFNVYASPVEGFGVGIYWDQACTNRTLSLDLGLVAAGSNNTFTVYVKNEGNFGGFVVVGDVKLDPIRFRGLYFTKLELLGSSP